MKTDSYKIVKKLPISGYFVSILNIFDCTYNSTNKDFRNFEEKYENLIGFMRTVGARLNQLHQNILESILEFSLITMRDSYGRFVLLIDFNIIEENIKKTRKNYGAGEVLRLLADLSTSKYEITLMTGKKFDSNTIIHNFQQAKKEYNGIDNKIINNLHGRTGNLIEITINSEYAQLLKLAPSYYDIKTILNFKSPAISAIARFLLVDNDPEEGYYLYNDLFNMIKCTIDVFEICEEDLILLYKLGIEFGEYYAKLKDNNKNIFLQGFDLSLRKGIPLLRKIESTFSDKDFTDKKKHMIIKRSLIYFFLFNKYVNYLYKIRTFLKLIGVDENEFPEIYNLLIDNKKLFEIFGLFLNIEKDTIEYNKNFIEIENLKGKDFEKFCAEILKYREFTVELTKDSHDYGADIIATAKNGGKTVLQCKGWKKNKVGIRAVQEIATAKEYFKANFAIVVTTSSFSNATTKFANELNVQVFHYLQLI